MPAIKLCVEDSVHKALVLDAAQRLQKGRKEAGRAYQAFWRRARRSTAQQNHLKEVLWRSLSPAAAQGVTGVTGSTNFSYIFNNARAVRAPAPRVSLP
jgi:hypothetical protein